MMTASSSHCNGWIRGFGITGKDLVKFMSDSVAVRLNESPAG